MDPIIQWAITGLIATLVSLVLRYLDKSDEDIKRRLTAVEKFDESLTFLREQFARMDTKLDILMDRGKNE